MNDQEWLEKAAHELENYPEAESLIIEMRDQISTMGMSESDTYRAVALALAGLARADVKGYISVADEHEWATLALEANRVAGES